MADLTDLEAALRLTEELQADLNASNLPDTVPLTRPAYVLEDETPERTLAVEFERKLCLRDQHLRDYYISTNQEYKLKLFPIFQLGSSPVGDYDTSVATFRTDLERERGLLRREPADAIPSRDRKRDLRAGPTPKLGQALRAARLSKGQKQEEVASRIGCAPSTISRIERGRQTPREHEDAIRQYIESAE